MSPGTRRVAGAVWLPAVVAALAVGEMATLRPEAWVRGATLEVLACVALCLRQRLPLAASLTALGAVILIPVLGTPLDEPATPIAIIAIAFFSLGRYTPGTRPYAGFVVVLAGVWADYRWFDDRPHGISDVVFVLVLAAPPFVLGRLMRRLADQQAALERSQALVRDQAVRHERDRIARDLHDLIAHSLSAMVVQTAAAQDLVRRDPERTEAMLAGVADTGRRALAETGALLRVVRNTAGEVGLTPAPGLAQVPELVARFRADGLDVELDLADPLPVLSAGVDVSVYRIVQEALTNALRHASDHTASLSIVPVGDRLTIRSVNASDDRGRGIGNGLGLLGMAERVAVLGGTLSHEETPDGRFVLSATLPLPS